MSVGLYVHIAYCRRKCAYCNFVSQAAQCVPDRYCNALVQEMRMYRSQHIAVDTVFVGGGTPSLLRVDQMRQIMAAIRDCFVVAHDAEITWECNPDSLTDDKLHALVELGVNRLSLGVQSLTDEVLRGIGRLHNADTAMHAVQKACAIPALRVNADYMVGLPGQTIQQVRQEVAKLAVMGVGHMSVYSLILEQDTPLCRQVQRGNISLPDVDTGVDMYDAAVDTLRTFGLNRYEISNFAKAGEECRHNQNCWRMYEYIGIGAAAASYLQDVRWKNPDDVHAYTDAIGKGCLCRVVDEECPNRKEEMIMLGLRTLEGLSTTEYRRRFGIDFEEEWRELLSGDTMQRVLQKTGDAWRIRPEYWYVSNSIIEKFF